MSKALRKQEHQRLESPGWGTAGVNKHPGATILRCGGSYRDHQILPRDTKERQLSNQIFSIDFSVVICKYQKCMRAKQSKMKNELRTSPRPLRATV